jgi:hypothetical protein
LPSRYNNPLATANTNTEACLIYILDIGLLNLMFIHGGLIFAEEFLNLPNIHNTLFFNLD